MNRPPAPASASVLRPLRGFTLVELAIVITIIGLLIGGVLKGQELLENSRVTASRNKFQSFVAATNTFRDIYKALPGDITQPSSFLQNCTAAPCNVAGDGSGIVGNNLGSYSNTESVGYWVHLAKAGLISGIDADATWSAGAWSRYLPPVNIGGNAYLWSYVEATSARYPEGRTGHFYGLIIPLSNGTSFAYALAQNKIMKYDLKFDDGKPFTGDVFIGISNAVIADGGAYKPDDVTVADISVRTGF